MIKLQVICEGHTIENQPPKCVGCRVDTYHNSYCKQYKQVGAYIVRVNDIVDRIQQMNENESTKDLNCDR